MGRSLINSIALRLNDTFPFRSRVFRSQQGNALSSQSPFHNQLISNQVLKHIFQYALISQPFYSYSTRGVQVTVYAYQTAFHRQHYPIHDLDKGRIERILGIVLASRGEKVDGIPMKRIELDQEIVMSESEVLPSDKFVPVKLRVVPVKYPYLDATILAQFVGRVIGKGHNLTGFFKNLKKSAFRV